MVGLGAACGGPGLMLLWERVAPSHVGKGGFASIMRLTGLVGLVGGFGLFYTRSIRTISLLPAGSPSTDPSWYLQNVSTASQRTNEK